MRDIIFTPLALPPIEDKQTILDRFDEPEKFVWWGEETLLGEKTCLVPLQKISPSIILWINFANSKQVTPFQI